MYVFSGSVLQYKIGSVMEKIRASKSSCRYFTVQVFAFNLGFKVISFSFSKYNCTLRQVLSKNSQSAFYLGKCDMSKNFVIETHISFMKSLS